jgi:hypothetical protein
VKEHSGRRGEKRSNGYAATCSDDGRTLAEEKTLVKI